MGPWARQFLSLSLSFLGCEMDLVIPQCRDDKRKCCIASLGAGPGLEWVTSEHSFLPFPFGYSSGAAETREVVCHARACGLHDPETPGKDEGTGDGGLGRVGLPELWASNFCRVWQNLGQKHPILSLVTA